MKLRQVTFIATLQQRAPSGGGLQSNLKDTEYELRLADGYVFATKDGVTFGYSPSVVASVVVAEEKVRR